ncbi:MAG: hypothetical protein JKY37_34575 [Nannocystaceae bacterium]|nr:hypothetical protein [Nannocystaceae bacterium]
MATTTTLRELLTVIDQRLKRLEWVFGVGAVPRLVAAREMLERARFRVRFGRGDEATEFLGAAQRLTRGAAIELGGRREPPRVDLGGSASAG